MSYLPHFDARAMLNFAHGAVQILKDCCVQAPATGPLQLVLQYGACQRYRNLYRSALLSGTWIHSQIMDYTRSNSTASKSATLPTRVYFVDVYAIYGVAAASS
jgi:hypothetical protein